MSERYIVIPSWDKFQHYKGQERPAWIKLYTHLLHDDDYLKLSVAQRSALFGLWLIYAEGGRQITANTASLSRQLGQRVTKHMLEVLNHAGFIEFSSRDGLETVYSQKRREEKKELTHPPTSTTDVAREGGESENSSIFKQPSRLVPYAELPKRKDVA